MSVCAPNGQFGGTPILNKPHVVISVYSQNVATLSKQAMCCIAICFHLEEQLQLCNNSWTSGGISIKHTAAHEAMQQSYELQIYWNQVMFDGFPAFK